MKKSIKPGWRTIIKRFGTWNVTGYGLEHAGPGPYAIPIKRLWESRLIEHMNEKNWVNILDFRMALKFAREYFEARKPSVPFLGN